MITIPLPPSLYKYFWDVKPEKIDPKVQAAYITERLLEYGDFDGLKWLEKTYGKNFLKEVVSKTKRLSQKSANFYSLFFGINPKNILCLQKDFRRKHRAIWNY